MEKNEKNYVWVLSCEWAIDYERGSYVRVFATKEKAQSEMQKDYEGFLKENNAGGDSKWNDYRIGNVDAYCCEEGDWTANRCTWDITRAQIEQ